MKKCPTLLVTREIYIKTTNAYHIIFLRVEGREKSGGKDEEELEPLCAFKGRKFYQVW